MTTPAPVLDLTNVITVQVTQQAAGLGVPNTSVVALFTSNQPSGWANGQTFASYLSADGVSTDFGSNSDAAAIAEYLFAQTPNILNGGGELVVIPLNNGETVRAAMDRIGQAVFYYGILIDNELAFSNPTEFQALVAKAHAAKKLFGYCSSKIADLQPGSPLDLVRSGGETRGRMMYYGNALVNGAAAQQTQMFAAAYLGRGLSTNFSAIGQALTMHGKTLVGATPDATVQQTQRNAATAAGIDVYVSVGGDPMLFTSGANDWFDDVYNDDWFAFALQTAGFDYLIPQSFKVPQTDEGIGGLRNAYAAVCEQAKIALVIAPGAWTGAVPPGVDQALFLQNIANEGYFIAYTPVAQQPQADRSARKAPPFSIYAKLAGAVQSSNVLAQMQQ